MVVDDDQEWVGALTDFLVEEGYSVTSAPNGLAALDKLSTMEPLVVITDVEMPIMDGRQLLGRVRKQHGRMPVIVVTGERARGDDAGLAGAFRIIGKPVPVEDLLSAISAAAAHRVVRLPLQRLWLAAGAGSPSRRRRGAQSRWTMVRRFLTTPAAPIVALVLLASSLALVNHWRAA